MLQAFSKMHALGNDFSVFYGDSKQLSDIQQKITTCSDRRVGIGFDQLLFIMKDSLNSLFFYIFNADGSQASQCLNGARCVARFLVEKKLVAGPCFTLSTASGALSVNAEDFSAVSLVIDNTAQFSNEATQMANLPYDFKKVTVGNQHFITQINSEQISTLDSPALAVLANQVEANLGFVQIISSQEIYLKTIERGSGETYACASNALATVALGLEEGWLMSPVTVNFALGSLCIALNEDNKQFTLTGSAEHVYDGHIRY